MEFNKKRALTVTVAYTLLMFIFISLGCFSKANKASAMPFYDLRPQEITLRSEFYTSYSSSTDERKANIKLAARSLNNVMVDVGGEFSFNLTVGERTVKRGYKTAKIIVNGEFVDGVGGGVCQVSSTLYNAVLLAGLKITEYHPHSLPVSYVSPSFDAMVNSGSADLKFVNNTYNPIIINTVADGSRLTVKIYGEPLDVKYERKSVIVEEIPALDAEEVFDDNGEYPELYEGESKYLRYGKAGYKSEGYLVTTKNGRKISEKRIRSDKYNPTKGLVILGRTPRPIDPNLQDGTGDNGVNIDLIEWLRDALDIIFRKNNETC